MRLKGSAIKTIVYALVIILSVGGIYLVYAHNETGGNVYMIMSVCLIAVSATAVICTHNMVTRHVPIHRLYMAVAVLLGMVYLFLIPIFSVPDEGNHFRTAYYYSDYGDVQEESLAIGGYMYIRSCDNVYTGHVTQESDYEDYLSTFRALSDEEKTAFEYRDWTYAGKQLLYLLPSLGIRLALELGLSFGWLSIFARFFNMIFFILMTAYAIYKIPYGKRTLFVIGMLPITLQQASSTSYDCPNLAAAFVVTALSLNWCVNGFKIKKDSWYESGIIELILYALSCAIMLQCKGGLYLLIASLPIIFCVHRLPCFKSRKSTAITIVVLIVIFALIMVLWGYDWLVGFMTGEPYVARFGTKGFSPITYIICYDYTIGTFKNTFLAYGKEWLYELFGGNLGWTHINVWGGLAWSEMALFVFSLISSRKDKTCGASKAYSLTTARRVFTVLLALGICFLSIVAMLFYWTESGSIIIDGVQGRYFLPTLMAFAIGVGYWKKPRLELDTDGIVCTASAFLALLVVIDVLIII